MAPRSAVAKSSTLAFSFPSPTPMLMTIFSSRGTWNGFEYPRSCMSAGITTVRNRSRSRGGNCPLTCARLAAPAGSAAAAGCPPLPPLALAAGCPALPPAGPPLPCWPLALSALLASAMSLCLVHDLAGLAGHADLAAVVQLAHPDSGRLAVRRVQQHHVRDMNRRFALDDAPLAHLLARPLVLLHQVEPLDDDTALVRQDAQHASALAALLARDHHHRVALPHMCCRHDRPSLT